ncbi:phenylalanine--tRNA ligase subunit alpha [Patescibacteria group bacterium]|nr:phenylalanine--tRNA ligase subunit alpha [Patescibacteria group bacterium]MBU1703040.1 phenylalanine--tRNA ligase subunit alpha [Patescibacteria group bacterium]MBU1954183.1 phenylalanine--tRNA ligase subunit alpha [Patescibacteria group bacterium]
MQDQLTQIEKRALQDINEARDLKSLQEAEVKHLGRKSALTALMSKLKDLSPDEKKKIGPLSNQIKTSITNKFEEKRAQLETIEIEAKLKTEFFDITIPGSAREIGRVHPLAQLQHEVENIFHGMGFTVADGPEIESEYYNFEGLNIPADHPARDMQDTFFVDAKHEAKHGRLVLRTQTSPVQIRTMEKYGAPLRIIVPGRVFRNEATDASHETTFHQVEGLLIDTHISLANLKGIMTEFLTELFKKEVSVRFRPGYFPFVEPGVELDFSCLICTGKGCSVCKRTGWVEFMGAGMVHPNVLKAGGIDSQKYRGWAFGFGLERLAMMRYGIDDIRLFHSGDLRFIKQF